MELWDILDNNGNITGKITSGSDLKNGENHLIIYVYIFNSKNELLIQRRSELKKKIPNIWETVCGSVIAGETSREAVIRETQEEIGIHLIADNLQLIKRIKNKNCFIDIWVTKQDIKLEECSLKEDEVTEIKYFPLHKALDILFYKNPKQELDFEIAHTLKNIADMQK